ncbi:hypothetical protein [Sporanaerobacter acetigenes]|uniref:Uncharacterized protein n=1 Tax=Sporanaerobacter acetigenes DSM 13106 TaxID=1123281 RepID=A0A1M5YJ21_9FIRM|nr:hypothetical protein [Sporanaerobacter acetigenes]SHI12031.1 hypothetical protein SAMN02745180_02232 [Sporanaerobacter acetigenes DSM 13106]
MDLVCPVCNGLYEINVTCDICFKNMIDKGPVVNYLDDYSPYLLDDIAAKVDGAPSYKCVHIYQCPNCKHDKRVEIDRIYI